MARRSRRKSNLAPRSPSRTYVSVQRRPNVRTRVPSRTISLSVYLPRSVVRHVRRVSYPYPRQRSRLTKVLRIPLTRSVEPMVRRRVQVVVPRRLPTLRASYVDIRRNRLNIHSQRQTRRLLEAEFNRRRYEELKTRSRKARHGQLESMRSDPLGMVGAAAQRGLSVSAIADHALVSRALTW